MSLIFKALQSVGQKSATPARGRGISRPPARAPGWRRWTGSPLVVLGAAAAIFASGILATYAVNIFSGRGEALTPPEAVAASSQAPEILPTPQAVRAPAGEAATAASSQPEAVRFYPAASSPMPGEGDAPLESGGLPWAAIAAADGPDDAQAHDPLPEDNAKAPAADALPQRAAVSDWSLPKAPPAADVLEPAPFEKASHASPEPAAKGFPPIDRQRQSTQATHHREVARLASKILGAIQADDVRRSSELLRQLVRIKGPQNEFVLKLKAYSLIRQERLDEARTLLSRVLARSAHDLEAGLNMAVIDIKAGRYDQARGRLTKLHERYPEKARIARYLRQLPRN